MILLVFGASGLPESKNKVKTMSTNGCANLHRKKNVAGRVFVDLSVLGGSIFDSISQFFDAKIASQILMEFRCRFGCRGAEGPGSARGGDYIPFTDFFESGFIRHAAVLRTVAADILISATVPLRHDWSAPMPFMILGSWN